MIVGFNKFGLLQRASGILEPARHTELGSRSLCFHRLETQDNYSLCDVFDQAFVAHSMADLVPSRGRCRAYSRHTSDR
jgi:hypothetical protein